VTERPTPSQTVGPFFGFALPWAGGEYVVPEVVAGAVWVRGTVFDGEGRPVTDALVETWQVGAGETGGGFGRCPTDAQGRYAIHTVKPEGVDGQAPHIAVSVFARGLLDRVVTRIYFADEAGANAADPVLSAIADTDARATLVAEPSADGYRFDIRLQGDRETVFFAL
jgi:protocatechuate 3,4-dioxygenase alpha subunit